MVSAGPDAVDVRVRSGSTLRSLPESCLISCTCLEGQEISKAPKKKEKTKKEEKITTTTKNQIKHEEFKVHLCKSIQELKRGCGRPGLFLLLLLGLLLPTASASASAIAQDDVSLDSYFSVQPIVGHQSFFVGAPNPAAWGGAGTLRVLGDSASNLGIPLATAPRFGQRNLLMLSGATLAALLRSGRTIL